MNFEGQVAAVTGASSGLGFAVASRLASEGAKVILIDIDEPRLDAAVARIGGAQCHPLLLDISSSGDVGPQLSALARELGGLDILVNAAAIWSNIPFEDLSFEEWRRIQAVNADGAFLVSHAAFRLMKAANYGRIVNFASTMFAKPASGFAPYAASKGAVVALTRAIAIEGGRFGISANIVAPGLIVTEGAFKTIDDAAMDAYVATQPVPRRGQPDDIVEAVLFLVSKGSGFTTGQIVYVNGGMNFG